MPKARNSSSRALPKKMHIYCEGEKTEPNYLNGYISDIDDRALRHVIIVEKTRKNTPVELVNVAIEHKKSNTSAKGDEFWVVYDRESVAKYTDTLHDKAYKRAKDNGINIALSNVCFEHWLLLHITNSSAPYTCYGDLINRSCLKEEFRKKLGKDYDKAGTEIYEFLSKNINKARRAAQKLNLAAIQTAQPGRDKPHHLNPYTDIPKLLNAIDLFC
ncbi:RloB family protein [Pseudomonas sp. HS6]|uniref:RloB family protein n=1 Tax=Pseudomonas sp. HS6 TaxID=2850559 RepID=UPI00201A1D6A|nr:RloB family protein [Pseudomonas sp. HS6]UQS13668.1 RloB domain-containing protein [Pseudomonas sp. HS6]